jgi:hypothetical protein
MENVKTCPSCSRTYSDETLNFCLIDGSTLSVTNTSQNEEAQTVIKPFTKKPKPKINVQTMLIIFAFMAIPITLFPPFYYGNERLTTEAERNNPISENFPNTKAKSFLPVKDYDFIFGNSSKTFSVNNFRIDAGYSDNNFLYDDYYDNIILKRELIISELILEYIIAFIAAFIISAAVQRFANRRKSKP